MTPRSSPPVEKSVMLDVTILGRVYKVACKESERDELTQAVTLLDRRMREIREAGKVSGADRIAVMAALNLAHELLRNRRKDQIARGNSIDGDVARRRIQAMHAAVDQALANQEKLF
jgi:cell division protein ZapA